MKSWSRSRGAKKRGVNWKATCCFCGKPIANRMKYDNEGRVRYAHSSCCKGKAGDWIRCW